MGYGEMYRTVALVAPQWTKVVRSTRPVAVATLLPQSYTGSSDFSGE